MPKRLALSLLGAVLLQLLTLSAGSAAPAPQFVLGFATLASLLPGLAGTPLESEHFSPTTGDSLQKTTTGLMVWRKADNWTAFTDGYRTWVNGPYGLQERLNSQRFNWERVTVPAPGVTVPAPASAAQSDISHATVTLWSQWFQDQKLKDALALAYSNGPDWRPFADRAAQAQVPVQWGTLSAGLGGITRTSYRRGVVRSQITLSARLQEEPTQVVAAVLSHETYHAATAGTIEGSEGCYQNEIAAYRWESYVWQKLPTPTTMTAAARSEDRLVRLSNSGQLEGFVRESSYYQQECSKAPPSAAGTATVDE